MHGGYILGTFPATSGKSEHYFRERHCFVDCRGRLEISPKADFGYGVRILTESHDISTGKIGPAVSKAVIIKDDVWVCSFSILYNCLLEEGVIVSNGAVISGVRIPAHCMVQGNPGMIVAHFDVERKVWRRTDQPIQPESWRPS